MRRTVLHASSSLGLLLSLVAAGCGAGGGGSSKAATTAPVTSQGPPTFRSLDQGELTGYRTTIPAAGGQVVASTAAELSALWAQHRPADPRPAVDFARERVAALFLGERPSTGWAIAVTEVADVASSLEVRYVVTRPSGAPVGLAVRPYHVVAIDRVTGPLTFRDVTPAGQTTTLTDVHGALAVAPGRAAGSAFLAFLPDGAAEPLELTDPTALVAAGARAGSTLVVSGDARANPSGATALGQALTVSAFTLDDVAVTARLEVVPGGRLLRDVEAAVWEPLGPQAATLTPPARPLRVVGRRDPAHRSAIGASAGVVVTGARPTSTVALHVTGGLIGADDLFAVDDLGAPEATGAYRFHDRTVIFPADARAGRGALAPADRAALEGLIVAAALRTQPTTFRPRFPVLDAPTTVLSFADAQGDVQITIQAGATLPPEVEALVTALRGHAANAASFRSLERGAFSGVGQAGVRVARDDAAWTALWAAHAGTGPGAPARPSVDFATQLVVAVFQGRQPTGGYAIEVTRLERAGDDLHLSVVRRAPAPGTIVTQVITAPYHLVVVDHHGATRGLWVDGTKQ